MLQKSKAYIFLSLAVMLCVLLVIFRPIPQFNYNFETFFPQDDESLDFYQSFKKQFENDNDYLLVALGNREGELFDTNFLTKANTIQSEIQKLDKVDTVISLLNLEQSIIGVFGVTYRKVLDWSDTTSLARTSGNLDQYRSQLLSKDGNSLLLWIKNEQDISKSDGDLLYNSIKEVFTQNSIKPIAVAGKIQTQGDFIVLMQDEFGLFFACSILLILLLLLLIFRSWWGVLIPFLVLIIGVAWAFGLLIFLGKPLDVMSVMQPTIFLIVGLSALIHFFTHLLKKLKAGVEKESAIYIVFRELTFPVWLTVMTTALGFISLYFTSIPALQDFGWSTGLGVVVMFVAVMLLAPGLLYLLPIKTSLSHPKSEKPGLLLRIFSWQLKHRNGVRISFLGVTLLCVLLGLNLKINGYLLDNLPIDHPIQQDFTFFDGQFGGSNPLEIHLSVGESANSLVDYDVLVELVKVESKIHELFGQSQTISPLTLVKSINQAQNQGSPHAFQLPSRGQFQRMTRWLDRAMELAEPKVLSADGRSGRISTRAADLGSLKMTTLRAQFDEFISEEINADLLQVRWTGTAYLIDKGHTSVTLQMAKGLGVAFLLVGVIAGFLFRSWRISFLLLIPNLIPLIWMFGLMYILGIEFKLTTAILFTVAFGIAVDDSIHFMSRLKFELASGKNLIYALKRTFLETGKAIVLTTIVLTAGFGLLIFSQFGVTHFTGLLISASLIFALLADLILLPLLLLPLKKMWEKKFKG
ncbi:putative RND superfamily exporter protein [Algoriphagus sp. 4150]|uniref:efflux RND transporter permease subunit n=1 Tax=Algoriphagus sp. 4150 TaxID=2817756 RepID=UPI0028603F22|nr:MMPL family transporter [Algoriphagus sp. 4150]MDR7130512.1 putative RND superfamily exporter protein [Algoriphagus sp. 4150]